MIFRIRSPLGVGGSEEREKRRKEERKKGRKEVGRLVGRRGGLNARLGGSAD